MIIISISAENLLKYAKLRLRDLPESGVIAISGPNESGKSAIGETICFALFGRTFSFGADEPEKIIRWGQSRCSVDLTFSTTDGEGYQIARFLDNEGNKSACLSRVGPMDDSMISGVEAVDEAVSQLLGYDFDEFIESFYLAQREITTPHPHSQAVKAMAGLAALEAVGRDIKRETVEERMGIADTKSKAAAIDAELEALVIQEGYLQELEMEYSTLDEKKNQAGQQSQALQHALKAYAENIPRLAAAQRGRRSIGILFGLLTLGVVGLAFSAWTPEPQSQPSGFPWGMLWGLLGPMWLIALGGLTIMKGRVEGLAGAAGELAAKLDVVEQVTLVPAMDVLKRGEHLSSETSLSEAMEEHMEDNEPDKMEVSHVCKRIAEYEASPDEVSHIVDYELNRIHEQCQVWQEEMICLTEAIDEERARLQKAAELMQMREAMVEKIADHQRHIAVRELAEGLLSGARSHLSQCFNCDLRELAGRTLPLFTEGRYEHLKVDDELNVQVFSKAKRDYMALDEISSGTQRQIMLAIRLALSQKLIDSTGTAEQFIFLDEPFAFFDHERTCSALDKLPELSDDITQIWIVAQEFPSNTQLARHIKCRREFSHLPADAA